MPTWKVELIPEAHADFKRLDGSVKKRVLKQLIKLEKNPDYGDPLGNKVGINLEGYFKLYADDKRIRIIYEEIDNIIKVIAIDNWIGDQTLCTLSTNAPKSFRFERISIQT